MPLKIPSLDDRSYQQLLDEALRRIPVHNPQWTNFNASDPGVTLIELFAFLTESLLYRSNQIPERNRRKFLSLLGLPLQPASSASGIVTFSNERGPLRSTLLNEGLEVRAGQVPFRTVKGLDVLPIEAQVYFKHELERPPEQLTAYYRDLYASFNGPQTETELTLYETVALTSSPAGVDLGTDTMDHSLWIALLARAIDKPSDNSTAAVNRMKSDVRKELAGKTLTLGMAPVLTDADRRLSPGGPISPGGQSLLRFEIPKLPPGGLLPDNPDQRTPQYRTLEASASADILAKPGTIQIPLPGADELALWSNFDPLEAGVGDFPPALEDTNLQDRLITWLRVRASSGVQAAFSWVGINATGVQQRAHVINEVLPRGTGEPDQVVILAQKPVLPDSVRLTVNGSSKPWEPIEDLFSAGPEVPTPDPRQPPGTPPPKSQSADVFAISAESGEIRFGDGTRGRRPPPGAAIVAEYDFGLGRAGNVGVNSINNSPALPAGIKVTNPIPTWGGAEAESVSEGEKHIARYLQHRDRPVNATDFETITLRTPGVDIGRVDVIPAFSPELPANQPGDAPGAVTLLIIPKFDRDQPEAPRPDRLFLDTICAYLNPRRLVTTEIFLRGPNYRGIWVSVGINVVAGFAISQVREGVKNALLQFLSPLPASRKELLDNQAAFLTTPQFADLKKGWPLRKPVVDRELMATASRVEGVLSVNGVLLAEDRAESTEVIEIRGLDLPRVLGISVVAGDALDIEELQGPARPSTAPPTAKRVVPVPVIPKEC